MKANVAVAAVLLIATLRPDPAHAWASANRWGGSTTHSWGETTHTNAWGGSTSGGWGQGATHTNAYGGTTSGGWGQGVTHTNVYGGSTYGAYGQGVTHTYPSGATAYRPPGYGYGYGGYYGYHPPVAVPYYAGSGCYGCAAAAGAIVGAGVGAAVASANTSAAYASGYAAGASAYAMGANYAALPGGCVYQAGINQYHCGATWFVPQYGANGVYYTVVPAP